MKKIHFPSLKFHTIYSIILAVLLIAILFFAPDISLFAVIVFMILYVGGNGIIHSRTNELSRDALIEYIIIATIVLVVAIGAFL